MGAARMRPTTKPSCRLMARAREASSPVTWNSVMATRAVVGYWSGWTGIGSGADPGPSPLAGGGPTGAAGGATAFGAGEGAGCGGAAGVGSGVFPAGATGSPARSPFAAPAGAEPVRAAAGFLPVGVDGLSGWPLDCASAAWAPSEARSRGISLELRTRRPQSVTFGARRQRIPSKCFCPSFLFFQLLLHALE